MKILRLPLFILAFFALGTLSYAAQLATVKALNVTGVVTKYTQDGKSELKAGDILKKGDSLSASALSSADLVFSNGSTLTLKENSSLTIAEFTQASFGGGQSYEQLEADPSKSQVLLELNYGIVEGHAKKLQQGSEFDVATPIGTAAIRGTMFSVELRYNAERGEFLLIVKNKDGKVIIKSRYTGNFEYREGVGQKRYNSNVSDDTNEFIPQTHTIIIRLDPSDPHFDDVYRALQSFIPPEDPNMPPVIIKVITPEPDDPGVQIVSPNTEDGDSQGEDEDNDEQ